MCPMTLVFVAADGQVSSQDLTTDVYCFSARRGYFLGEVSGSVKSAFCPGEMTVTMSTLAN